MSIFVKNDKMLRTLRIWGLMTSVWPLEDGSSRLQVIFYKALSWLYLVNDFCMILALINGISYYRNDFNNMLKSILELIYVFELIVSISYRMTREKRFRRLLAEVECVDDKRSSPYEEILRRKFMFNVRVIYIGSIVGFIICGLTYLISPLLSQKRYFPTNAIFPLLTSETWAWYLIYIQNSFVVLQTSLLMQVDLMVITILWNATFKFHLLGMQMHSVFTVAKLRAAIKEHQKVLDYAQEGGSIGSFLIVKTMIIIFINTINESLMILHDAPFWEEVQFVSIIMVSFIRLYIVCLAAEKMTDTAYEISWRIYDTPWIYATPSVRRTVCMIMQRCQKSVTIKATAAVPMISVQFCRKVVSAGFSYFLTLRTILSDRI